MSVSGKYILSHNENYMEWLTAVGIPADKIAKLVKAKPQMDVIHTGNDVVLKSVTGEKNFTITITLGKESKVILPTGTEYTLNMTLSGSTLSGTFSMADKTGTTSVEFTGAGATQSMTYGGITAKRVYTRQ